VATRMSGMRRWIAALLMLVMLPWQAMGWAATALADSHDGALHAIAHWSGEAHHHDGHDEGFHQDESEESIQHAVHSDAHLNALAVLPLAVELIVPAVMMFVPDGFKPGGHPCPYLEGPRRPPRSSC
jgi:hypothetical protein